MDLKTIGDLVVTVGFPGFVAIFVLVRLEPAITRLRQSITTLMVVTAKSNGMSGKDVAEIVRAVADSKHNRRRVEDRIDGVDDKVDAASGVAEAGTAMNNRDKKD